MNLYVYGEDHPYYQALASENTARYYGFLRSIILSALRTQQYHVTDDLIKAINHHVIAGLHPEAGTYRTGPVTVGNFSPPPPVEILPFINTAIRTINNSWSHTSGGILAAYALWAVNHVHPFVNGNGRTARAICYFILCVKAGGLLPGQVTIPELLRMEPLEHNISKRSNTLTSSAISSLSPRSSKELPHNR